MNTKAPITAANNTDYAFKPASCVFVGANAGSGKTSLLTNRVLSLLLHGVEPGKILCLTFTNAAASEMSNRILKELGKWVVMDAAALRASVGKLTQGNTPEHVLSRARGLFAQVLESPEGVRIQTIHGFCQSLLRRFPLEAGVTPHFSVMDGRSEQEALADARIRLFSNARAPESAIQTVLDSLAKTISEHSFNALLDEVVKNKRRFRSLLPEKNIAVNLERVFYERFNVHPDTSLASLTAEYFSYNEDDLKTLRVICAELLQGKGMSDQATAKALERWLLQQHNQTEAVEDYCAAFLTAEGEPRKSLFTKATLKDEKLIEILLAEQQRVVQFSEKFKALAAVKHSIDVLHIAEALLAEYEAIKHRHAWMDYDDLILTASNLLSKATMSPWVLFKLDGGIDHILVDEAQDTSPEQWHIIQALTQEFFAGAGKKAPSVERSLFIVGDEKQSIYSFQGADVAQLGHMQAYFTKQIEAAQREVFMLALTKSYRSTKEILQAVDTIFSRPEASAGLTFSNTPLHHITTREHAAGLVELWPLVKGDKESANPISPATQLARNIADNIAQWLHEGTAKPEDIMVLVRTRTGFVDRLIRALKKRGVPVAGVDRMELNDNIAVQDLIAFGQILLLPEDDLTLAALLKSPIFNFSEEALFTLAYGHAKHQLWNRLATLAQEGKQPFIGAYQLLSELRAKADFVPPFELYSELLDARSARANFTGRMGEESADPIDEFMNQLLLYERSHAPSLQGFLHWLMSSDSEIKRDMEQAKSAVRIMTIHGAKGLQSKIAILPDTTSLPKEKDSMLWLGYNNHVLPVRAPSSKQDDPLCKKLRAERKQASAAEYRRQLYVALTRAEDRLYMCGASNDAVNEQSWYSLIKTGLSSIAEELADGTLRLGSPPQKNSAPEKNISTRISFSKNDFAFLLQPVAAEPSPSQPLTPSRLAGELPAAASPLAAGNAFAAGNYIHSLLQHLPNIAAEKRAAAAQQLAKKYSKQLSSDIIERAITDATNIISHPDFAFLFDTDVLAEIPVAGIVEVAGKKLAVSGQIDRLSIQKDTVWIIDFKSNQLPPANMRDIPVNYVRQLALYQLLLRAIYPEKTVQCGLLWTASAKLDVLPQALLDEWPGKTYI